MGSKKFKTRKEESSKQTAVLILLLEILLILVVFNASSYFNTTTYAKSIDIVGVALTMFLLFWIWVNSRFHFGYGRNDLGLTVSSVSRRQWTLVFATVFLLYLVAFAVESVFQTEVEGEVTLTRLFFTAVFTLTFGPIFEELLFRGYLFKRSQDAFCFMAGSKLSIASVFSGLAFALWHLPTPIILLYFNDPIIKVYGDLSAFILAASVMGIILGEVRRTTKSILPRAVLHFCANSIYVITVALRLF